ncbi:Replication factor-A carboxy-terminal domain protein [Arachis hypogaea]|nr:Replication factor-A carboxy-terminal domain protein [Arachis hypogaea]
MAYFSVVANQGNYRTAEHEFKLIFLNRTSVVPVADDAIPKTCFSFCPFDELLKMTDDYVYLVDVIRLLTSVGEEKEYVKDGKYVDEVHHFLGSGYMEQPVVVIQLAKVKFFRARCFVGQVCLQNVMHATRLFFNPDLAEVVDFKNSMVDQDINGTQPLFIANEGKGVSLEDDFMRLIRRYTIEELHDNNKEGSFVVFGIVRSIVDEGPWWYSACVCGKSIQPQGGAYYCDFCQHYITNVTPKVVVFICLFIYLFICDIDFCFLFFLCPSIVSFSLFHFSHYSCFLVFFFW